ncbi:MAG: hypothetical protein HRU75_08905 [Planctomycetia bacterium]|nr:MAG: hypothetical protein HRU75_08905 [Planctomycetia bacterium]
MSAMRPFAPDAPLVVEGEILPGDTTLMLRCMLEEMLRGGMATDEIRALSGNPEYQALYAARCAIGAPDFEALLGQVGRACGVHRVAIRETAETAFETPLTIRGDAIPERSSL